MKGLIGWFLFIALAVGLFMLLQKDHANYPVIALSDFTSRLELDKVRTVEVRSDELVGEFTRPEPVGNDLVGKFRVPLPEGTSNSFLPWLIEHRQNAKVMASNQPNLVLNILVPLIPWILVFGFVWFFVFRQLRKQQNNKVGDAIKVYVVNFPGEPPLAQPAPTQAPR